MKPCTVNDNAQADQSPKQDVYAPITAKIVAALEDGVGLVPGPGTNTPRAAKRPCVTMAAPPESKSVAVASASVQGFAARLMTYRRPSNSRPRPQGR